MVLPLSMHYWVSPITGIRGDILTCNVRIRVSLCAKIATSTALFSITDEYAKTISSLSGNAFQAEVCARLQSVILDFQTIPAKPHGDAGLDGFSHLGTRGYCCFGPEYSSYKTNKSLETAIVSKFRSDLRKLLELDFKKKQLICKPSLEMPTILPSGQKLAHIELLVNWFESHRIIGPMTLPSERVALSCWFWDVMSGL